MYITPLVAGFQDILEGEKESKGLPSFIKPLQVLNADETIDIKIILVSNFKDDYQINVDWIDASQIVVNINNDLSINNKFVKFFRKIKSTLELFSAIIKVCKQYQIDFIYCHGKAAILGNLVSFLKKIPCGYRVYGTVDLAQQLNKYGRLVSIVRNPIYTLIFWLPKEFLLITDDGTKGDQVYTKFCLFKNSYKFYFLKNGVDFKSKSSIVKMGANFHDEIDINTKYIFHAGRIDSIKRQDRVLKTLEILKKDKIDIKLYFAGHFDAEDKYFKKLQTLIIEYNLQDNVKFLGPINRESMIGIARNAITTLLLGDISNRGNVFYEIYSRGGIITSLSNSGLDEYICNDISGFLIKNEDEAASVIKKILLMSDSEINHIKQSAINNSTESFKTWEQRVEFETQLLKSYKK